MFILKKLICLLVVTLILSSCEKRHIYSLPFEVTKDVSCDELYNEGYKRSFGADVILIGKKMNDTTIYYEIDLPSIDPKDITFYDSEENIETEIDTVKKVTKYDKYLEMDALELNDSIYELVWQDINLQENFVCDEGIVSWRNVMIELKESETINYRNTIDTTKYKVLNAEIESNYSIDKFKVVNLITKDTFNCSVYKQNKKYYFSSTFALIKYD
jgi:hypothetical protein